MELELTQEDVLSYELTAEEEQKVIQHVEHAWTQGLSARKQHEWDWQECQKAYRCEADPLKDKRLDWRSNLFLPWAYNAVESWHAYIHSLLLPRDEDFLNLEGRTPDDAEANRLMSQYLQYVFRNAGLAESFSMFLKTYAMQGPAVLKVYWRSERRRVQDPVLGIEQEELAYHNVWFDWVDMADFVFYPVLGDIEKTTRIHRTRRHLEDLQAAQAAGEVNYMNLEAFSKKDISSEGLTLKEAWIPRIQLGEAIYKNVVATIAEAGPQGKAVLIRFVPNPLDQGRSPFVYDCMQTVGNNLLGWGLLSKSMPLLKYANFLTNARADSLKRGLYPMFKYVDDGVFNPYNVVARPHAMIKVGDLGNLVPITDGLDRISFAQQELQQLKAEYEESTVPRIVRGQIEATNPTATEMNYAQNNASGKMNVVAQRLNEKVLKPLFELAYQLIQTRVNTDPNIMEDIARVTQPNPMGVSGYATVEAMALDLPKFTPLPLVDVKLVGYQHNARRMERLEAMETTLQSLMQSPASSYIQWDRVAESVLKLQNLPVDDILIPAQARQAMLHQQLQMEEQQKQVKLMRDQIEQEAEMHKIKTQFDLEWHQLKLEKERLAYDLIKALPEETRAGVLERMLFNHELASDLLGLDAVIPDFPIDPALDGLSMFQQPATPNPMPSPVEMLPPVQGTESKMEPSQEAAPAPEPKGDEKPLL
jgi:hypothetical protein